MTSLTLDHTARVASPGAPPAGTRSGRLLRGLRLGRTAPRDTALPTTGASAGCGARGFLPLTLWDGVPRLYLLDHRDFAATTSPEVAYDARVDTAYLLALQGHRADRLAQQLGLPPAAAQRIAEHARRSGPAGPGTLPPRT